MTLDELSQELNVDRDLLLQICAAMQIPHPGNAAFTSQQVLRISTHVMSGGSKHGPWSGSSAPPASPVNQARETPYNSIHENDTASGGAFQRSLSGAGLTRLVFSERFDLLQELGSGGMGRVLKAFDRTMQREVAVKRLKNPSGWDDELLTRFVREARLAGRLNHPNIMTVYDILVDDEGPYLVLEYIDGESLADRLERGPIPWQEAIELLRPVCSAVSAAHAQGIIHRDIKPANILITKYGVPKLGDFGIARSLEGQGVTLTGAALGTLDYMAPEQMSSARTADERADIYSLAATLYHMVTGEAPRPILAQEIPADVRGVITQWLNRRPDLRYLTVSEFADALHQRLSSESEISQDSSPGSAMTTKTSSRVEPRPAAMRASDLPSPLAAITLDLLDRNLSWWKECGGPEQFVRKSGQQRSHFEWEQLIANLKRSEFWPMREEDVGNLLEETKRTMLLQEREAETNIHPRSSTRDEQLSVSLGKRLRTYRDYHLGWFFASLPFTFGFLVAMGFGTYFQGEYNTHGYDHIPESPGNTYTIVIYSLAAMVSPVMSAIFSFSKSIVIWHEGGIRILRGQENHTGDVLLFPDISLIEKDGHFHEGHPSRRCIVIWTGGTRHATGIKSKSLFDALTHQTCKNKNN